MKKILITGGVGFIGTNLCKKLLEDDNNFIYCIDNFYTARKENLNEFRDYKNFKFIENDVINPYDIEVDEIYNLACPASPPHYQKNPIYTAKISFLGTLNALENAKKYNAKILQASTSEVYGDPEVHPQKETYKGSVNPIGIRACYDEGKRISETLCFDYNRMYKTKIKVIRIFNTYGPFMDPDDGRVVSNFILQALRNEDITVYGEGTQTRSFCYVDDLVSGIIKMMNSREDFLGPVNLGNPDEFKVIELAEIVIRLTKSKSKIIKLPLPADDPKQRRPDISLAKKELNWEPKIKLEEGLIKTIEYFKQFV